MESITSPRKIRINHPDFVTGITDYSLTVMDYSGTAITGSPFAMSEIVGMAGVYETASEVSFPSLGTYMMLAESALSGITANVFREVVISAIVPATSEAPPSVSTCAVQGHILEADGTASENVKIVAQYVSVPSIQDDAGVSTRPTVAYTDANGFFSINLIRDAIVNVSIREIDYNATVEIPDAASADLFTL